MTTNKLQLGRFKAAEVYRQAKMAGVLSMLGSGAKYLGNAFRNGSGLKRIGMLAGGAAGASAVNEGLGAAGLPNYSFDGDRQWSPEMQSVRNHNNNGILGQAGEFFKRPIQYLTSSNAIPGPNEAMRANGTNLPDNVIAGYSFDASGNPVVHLKGDMAAPFSSSYQKYLQSTRQQNHALKSFNHNASGNTGNSNGNGNNSGQRQDFRYGDNTLSVPNVF